MKKSCNIKPRIYFIKVLWYRILFHKKKETYETRYNIKVQISIKSISSSNLLKYKTISFLQFLQIYNFLEIIFLQELKKEKKRILINKSIEYSLIISPSKKESSLFSFQIYTASLFLVITISPFLQKNLLIPHSTYRS